MLEEQIHVKGRTLATLSGQRLLNLEYSLVLPEVLLPLAGLPEQTLERRPDLKSAYHRISARDYQTRVAYKALLPSIDLQTALLSTAASPSGILTTSPGWLLLGGLTAPLFNGGQLRSQAEIAKLETEQAYWQFRNTLLTAVQEVEDTLG